jgi:hypothetical protein
VSNPSRRKGTEAEVAIRDYLRAHGYPHAERLAQGGSKDRGDLTGIDPRVVIEIKNHGALDLAGWLREVEVEVANAGADVGMVWHKRRGTSDPGLWYVTMRGLDAVELLNEYTGTPRLAVTG